MMPLLSILIALMLGLLYPGLYPDGPPFDPLGAVLVFVGVIFAGQVMVRRAVRQVMAAERPSPAPLLSALAQQRLLVVAGFAILVYFCHWPAVVRTLGIDHWLLLDELVILLPFAALLFFSFLTAWSGEHALGLHEFRRWEYVNFQVRQFLFPIAPIFAFLALNDLVDIGSRSGNETIATAKIVSESYPFVSWVFFAVMLFALYCLMPFVMRWLWKLEPLPEGELRDRLMEFSRRENFRARELLVWPTGGNVINAAVIGLTARFRYVLMTDALIERLSIDEVEAVFAHEVGHAKHNHLLKFFLFILGHMVLMGLIWISFQAELATILGSSIFRIMLFMIGGILLWFGVLMGFISRRFEQQADVFGALATGRAHGVTDGDPDEHPFVRALTQIAMQMGDIREMKGWRHFSLGSRIEFIGRFLTEPDERRRYRRRIAGLLVFFFGLLGTIGVLGAATVPKQIRDGRISQAMAWAAWLEGEGRTEEAERELHRANQLAIDAGRIPAPVDPVLSQPELWQDMNRRFDSARSENLGFAERLGHMRELAIGYLQLGMPGAARATLDEIFILTGPITLPAMYEAQLLELMGLALAAEGHPKGARMAFDDALSLIPPEAPGGRELSGRIRASLSRLDQLRNR